MKKPKTRRIVIELFDTRNRNVGLGEFTWQLLGRFAKRAPELKELYNIELWFVVYNKMRGAFGDRVGYIVLNNYNRHFLSYYPLHVDLLHVTHQYCRLKHLRLAEHNLLTIHDINFMYEKEKNLPKYISRFKKRMNYADHLAFISNFAKSDVEEHFPFHQPARVIYNGVADLTRTHMSDLGRTGIPDHYLFHISSLLPKKNVHLLIEMMQYLPEENLVVVGNWDTDYGQQMKERIEELGLSNVYALPPVSETTKAALYSRCKGFLFPSLCEGFGLPPLEAAMFGKPVFLSTLTSLPEVGGKEAYYWPELEPAPMADVIREGLRDYDNDPFKAQRLRNWATQFNWDKCVDEYIEYYLDILGIEH